MNPADSSRLRARSSTARYGQVALGAGGGIPLGAVGHRGGERGLALPVDLVQRVVAAGEFLLPRGGVVFAAAAGGLGFGAGAEGGQAGGPGGGADLAQLVTHVPGCPGGLDGVGVAQVQQPAVGHPAHVRPAGRADGGQGLVPGGPNVRRGRGRFGPDRLGGVSVAGQFPPRADRRGPLLPVQPGWRMPGDRTKSGDRSGELMFGGVLADPVVAGVHQRGDLGEVGAAVGVGDAGDLRGPRARRERDRAAEPVPDPCVDDAGHVPGAGQVPSGDGIGEDLSGVQAG